MGMRRFSAARDGAARTPFFALSPAWASGGIKSTAGDFELLLRRLAIIADALAIPHSVDPPALPGGFPQSLKLPLTDGALPVSQWLKLRLRIAPMNSRQAEKFLAEMCPRSPADLDVRGRKLRESGDLPSGGRGPHAPELEASHWAKWLIGLAGTKKAVDAAEAVKDFSGLVPVDKGMGSFGAAETFLDALTIAIGTYSAASTVTRIVLWHKPEDAAPFQQSFAAAEVTWEQAGKTRVTLYAPKTLAAMISEQNLTLGGIVHDCTVMGAAFLAEVAARGALAWAATPPLCR